MKKTELRKQKLAELQAYIRKLKITNCILIGLSAVCAVGCIVSTSVCIYTSHKNDDPVYYNAVDYNFKAYFPEDGVGPVYYVSGDGSVCTTAEYIIAG